MNPTTIKTRGTQSGVVQALVAPGASTLAQLADVNTSGVANGYFLVYNTNTGKWEASQSVPSISAGTLTTPQTRVSLRYTDTIGAVPTAGDLNAGEILINRAEGKLFFKDTANNIVTLQSGGGGGSSANNIVYIRTSTKANFADASYNSGTQSLSFYNADDSKFDGVSLSIGDKVLIKDQSDARQNGIYTVQQVGSGSVLWILQRTTGFQTSEAYRTPLLIVAQEGVSSGDTIFVISSATVGYDLDTDPITFSSPLGVFTEINVANNVFLKSAGIGVGIASPSEAIDIAGNIKLSGNIISGGPTTDIGKNSSASLLELNLGKGRVGVGSAKVNMFGSNGTTPDTVIQLDGSTDTTTLTAGKVVVTADSVGINATPAGGEVLSVGGEVKVAGPASITGDLTIGTDALVVNAVTERVGINKAVPTEALDVVGNVKATGKVSGSELAIGAGSSSTVFATFGGSRTANGSTQLELYGSAAGAASITRVAGDAGALNIANSGAAIALDAASVAINAPATFQSSAQIGTNLSVGGNLTLTGNLIVNGTTTTVNSTVTTVDDPVLTVGGDTAPTIDDAKDRGIEFRWHDGSSAKRGFFGFDRSTGKFSFIPDATNTGEVFTGTKGTFDVNVEWSDVLNKPDPTITLGTDASGSVTLTDLGSATLNLTLNNVNSNVGTFPKVTVNAKGLVTAAGALIDSDIPSVLSANARVAVEVNGSAVDTRRKLNFVPSSNVSISGNDVGGQEKVALSFDLTNTGVTAGAGYNFFTVDAKGRVTLAETKTYLLAENESKDFKTISVSDTDTGYTWSAAGNVIADAIGDTLFVVSGAGINVDADTTADALRITNTDRGSSQAIFKNIAVSGQTTIVADNNNSTLTVAAGTGVSLTTDATSDTLTIALGASGVLAGTYNNVAVDSTGRVTNGTTVAYLTSESTDFKRVQVTDTDTGYTWAGTGTAIAGSTGDLLKIVSGTNINVDVDATNKAIRISNTFSETDTLASVTGRGSSTNTAVTLAGGATIDGTTSFRNAADATTVSVDADTKKVTIGTFAQQSVSVTGLSTSLIAIDTTPSSSKLIKYLVYVDAGDASEASELHILRGQDNSVQIVQYGLLTTAGSQIVSFAAEYNVGDGTTKLYAQTTTGTADIQLMKTTIVG